MVAHFAEAQHRQRLIGPMAVTEAPLDSFQVAPSPALLAFGRQIIEWVSKLCPAAALVIGGDS
eukprot:2686444-Pyramimonas_sp.AAC.1